MQIVRCFIAPCGRALVACGKTKTHVLGSDNKLYLKKDIKYIKSKQAKELLLSWDKAAYYSMREYGSPVAAPIFFNDAITVTGRTDSAKGNTSYVLPMSMPRIK